MKKFLLLMFILGAFVSSASAVEISYVNFPDETFRDILANDFDADEDGRLSRNEITAITRLTLSGMGISSLEGIEYLTALEYLDCADNHLTLLDLSNNTGLTDLICSRNQLIWLNIDNCTGLEFLALSGNNIPELNISGCPMLYAEEDGGYVFSFEYDKDTTDIVFEHVPNPTIDSKPAIRAVKVPYAEIGASFTLQLKARGTQPITWSIFGTLPEGLTLSDDTIAGIPEISGDFNIELRAENSLGYDDVAINISVADTVTISGERFPDENFRAYLTAYEREIFDGDGRFSREELALITEIDITGGIAVVVDGVQFSGTAESLAGIEYFNALEKLSFSGNNITEVNLSGNANLKSIQCSENRITFLDVMSCDELVSLDCSANRLNVLELGNTVLKEFHCDNNPLLFLNIDKCAELSDFSITETGLPKLNIGGCPKLYSREEVYDYDDEGKQNSAGYEYTYNFAFDDGLTEIVFGTVTDDPFAPKLSPVISHDSLVAATVSRSYTSRLQASGSGPITWALKSGTLPAGLSLDVSGLIYGIPASAGNSAFTVTASNAYGTNEANFTLQVMDAVSITTASLKTGKIDKFYTAQSQSLGQQQDSRTASRLTREGKFRASPQYSVISL